MKPINGMQAMARERQVVLVDFILKAKRSGYATGGEQRALRFADGALGFEFSAGEYAYTDRYYGFNPFSGSEHVYQRDGSLIWTMNYYGEVLSTSVDPHFIFAFLKQALSLLTPQYPFRGPAFMKKGRFIYRNDQNGTLDRFVGSETIHDGDAEVYRLHYHGGHIQNRQ